MIRPTRFIITSRTGADTAEQCVSLRPCVLMKTQAIALIRLVNQDTGAQSPIAPLGIDSHSRRSRLPKTVSANLYGRFVVSPLVARAGLEPAHLAAQDPKPCVSANSTTRPAAIIPRD